MSNVKHLYEIKDDEGRRLITSWTNIEDLVRRMSKHDGVYTYFRGKKVTSAMNEDEIYAIAYGSKAAYEKRYNDQNPSEVEKKELLYSFLAVASPEVINDFEEKIKNGEEIEFDSNLVEYVLDLANGATCEEVIALINDIYSSGFAFSWMIRMVAKCSLRGEELLNYYKNIDPTGFELYIINPNEEKKKL